MTERERERMAFLGREPDPDEGAEYSAELEEAFAEEDDDLGDEEE